MSCMHTIPGILTANEHGAILVDLNRTAKITRSAPHRVYLRKVNWNSIKAATSEFVGQFCVEARGRSFAAQWESIEKLLAKILNELILSKLTKTRTDQPWLCGYLKDAGRNKERFYSKWEKIRSRQKYFNGASLYALSPWDQ